MKGKIEKVTRVMATTGTIGIMLLLLASIACAEVPISDGFDYPVGNCDNFDGWYTSLFLGDSWSSYYGHLGEDYLKSSGSSKGEMVYSASNGIVYKVYTGSPDSWGGVIIIKHTSPAWNNFSVAGTTLPDSGEISTNVVYTLYGHINLTEIYVNENENVNRRTPIGRIGVVSKFPTPHLHFEIMNQTAINTEWESGVGHGYSGTDNSAPNHYSPSGFINANRPQISPLIGDWNGDGIDTNGTFNSRTSTFSLKDEYNQEVVSQQFGEPGDFPIVGDWNGNGNDSIGIYRPKTAEFHLDNNNDGACDYDPINFGVIGDYPIVGDWDGDGDDDIGVFRSLDSETLKTTFFLKHPDKVDLIEFGAKTDFPVIGDWNNNGEDDVGVFRRNDPDYDQNAVFYLRNGVETIAVVFGNNDDIPIVGKPEFDGLTRIGIYRPSTQQFIFKPEIIIQSGDCLDLIIAFDTTGSMWDDIANAQASAVEIVEALDSTGFDYRVAIADYRDYPENPYGEPGIDYVYNLDQPFSNNKSAIVDAINNLTLGWGNDWKESVYSALVESMLDVEKDTTIPDNYGWRKGAFKAIILLGDAPPQGGPESHIPEPWDGGYSLDNVVKLSKDIDPIRVYSIVVGSDTNTYAAFSEISEKTGGKVYLSPNADDVSDAIIKAIEDMEDDGYGVEVSITPTQNEANPGNSVIYSVNTTNKGDLADVYDVSFETENIVGRGYPLAIQYSWIMFDNSEIKLNPSISEIRLLSISVPENWAGMEDINYTFGVNAKSKTNADVSNTSSAELKIKANKKSMIEYSRLEIQWLAELVDSSTIDQGIKNALLAKLANAESKADQALVNLDNGKVELADNMLEASQNALNSFANQVDAQYDKKIMQPDAKVLKEKVNQITEDIEIAKNN